jgi:hypothetical protein
MNLVDEVYSQKHSRAIFPTGRSAAAIPAGLASPASGQQ